MDQSYYSLFADPWVAISEEEHTTIIMVIVIGFGQYHLEQLCGSSQGNFPYNYQVWSQRNIYWTAKLLKASTISLKVIQFLSTFV